MEGLVIKILFVRPFKSSFIQKDLELLEKHFDVKIVDFVAFDLNHITQTLKTIVGMILGTIWADVSFSWFCDYHTLWAVKLSKLFQKKSIIIVGGYDVVQMPEIEYGASLNPKFLRILHYVLKNTDKILSFSQDGAANTCKHLNTSKIEVVYLGVDNIKIKSSNKEKLVLTTAYVKDSNLQRKGLKTFVKAAKYLPHINFLVIGPHIDGSINHLKSIATPNVKFTGYISDEELFDYYQKAKVYVQVSAHEGFGLAMAEAMSYQCVPVVTDRGAIREVVGDTGFYVEYDDPEETANAIKKALESDKGKVARKRIENLFTIRMREEKLLKILNSL